MNAGVGMSKTVCYFSFFFVVGRIGVAVAAVESGLREMCFFMISRPEKSRQNQKKKMRMRLLQ